MSERDRISRSTKFLSQDVHLKLVLFATTYDSLASSCNLDDTITPVRVTVFGKSALLST